LPEETERALLQILCSSQRYVDRHYQVYNQNLSVFGTPGSRLRRRVQDRRRYLEKLRLSKPEVFAQLCCKYDLQQPTPASPPTDVVELAASGFDSSFTESMSTSRNRRGQQKGKNDESG
jgi:hypothetical protein